ncbi:hypothetical protein ABT075_22285 [Streptomyces sp. NPDC002677]|uniref:hypothetical protein n=1 Tax=Streptomyces sp. NPDC002677 TaxID=3154774 RepID=UPI0033317F08
MRDQAEGVRARPVRPEGALRVEPVEDEGRLLRRHATVHPERAKQSTGDVQRPVAKLDGRPGP